MESPWATGGNLRVAVGVVRQRDDGARPAPIEGECETQTVVGSPTSISVPGAGRDQLTVQREGSNHGRMRIQYAVHAQLLTFNILVQMVQPSQISYQSGRRRQLYLRHAVQLCAS